MYPILKTYRPIILNASNINYFLVFRHGPQQNAGQETELREKGPQEKEPDRRRSFQNFEAKISNSSGSDDACPNRLILDIFSVQVFT